MFPVRQASSRHFNPRQDRLYFSDLLSDWNVASIDLLIAGPDQRMEDVDQRAGVPPDRAAQGRCQHLTEPIIACRGLGDRSGQNATDGDRQLLGIVQNVTEVPRQLDLTPEQQSPQLLEPGIERRDAGRFYADVGIDISGKLEQQPRKHLAIKAGIDRGRSEQPLERSGGGVHLTSRRDLAGDRPRRLGARALDAL